MKKIPDFSIHPSTKAASLTLNSDALVGNLGVIFDPHLLFSNPISNISRLCYMHVCIRPWLHFKTAPTIATSIVQLKLDYHNVLPWIMVKPKCNHHQGLNLKFTLLKRL